MTVRGTAPETLLSVLEGQGGALVREAQILDSDGNRVTVRVFPRTDQPLAQPISEIAHRRGWLVQELYAEHGQLDEVFRDLTTAA